MSFWKRKQYATQYDVLIKAVQPKKVVVVARVNSLEAARKIADGMTKLGFETMVSWQEPKTKKSQDTKQRGKK